MATDPLTLSQLQNLTPVETSFGGQVKVFYGGHNWEVSRLDATAQAVVGPASGLDVDQQAEALLGGELGPGDPAQPLPELAIEAGVTEMYSPDDDLASVFQYLLARKR